MFVVQNFVPRFLSAVLLWSSCLGVSSTANAQEDPSSIDMLTENVGIGVIARNLQEFNEEFSAICKEAQFPIGTDDLSDLFYFPLNQESVDVDRAIDRQGSGGLVLLGNEFEETVIRYMYPVMDSKLIAEAYRIDPMEFKAGSAYRWRQGDVVMLDGKMCVGMPLTSFNASNPAAPEPIDNPFAGSKPIGNYLSSDDRKFFGDADVLFMLGSEVSKTFWAEVLRPVFGSSDNGSQTWDRLEAAGKEIRFGLAAIDLDEGIHARSKSFFTNTTDGAALQLIRDIRGGEESSNLNFLPDAQVLVAAAARGEGEQNVTLARSIVRLIVEAVSPGEEILSSDDKTTFYESFESIWKQLNGTRMALYRNETMIGEGGELALVTIFDVEDPKALLAALPDLVQFANDGISRMTPEGEEPNIGFEYKAGNGGGSTDILAIDTMRISDVNSKRFKRFFGSQANEIRFVPQEKHVVMFVGSNPALLEATLENLKTGNAGLSDHPAIIAANLKIDPRRKIEFHFSAENFNSIYSAMIRKREDLGKYERPAELTSFALVIEEDRFGFDFWIPKNELKRATKLLMAWTSF